MWMDQFVRSIYMEVSEVPVQAKDRRNTYCVPSHSVTGGRDSSPGPVFIITFITYAHTTMIIAYNVYELLDTSQLADISPTVCVTLAQ